VMAAKGSQLLHPNCKWLGLPAEIYFINV